MKRMFRPLRTLGLTDDERGAMRNALASRIATNPVRMGADDRLMGERSFWYRFVFLKPIPMVIPIVALIMALTGGTAFAAEGSLPGDVLYPVKIHVNERARVALAVSDEAEAVTQTALAAERLDEAATLQARGTLTTEVRDRLADRFARHEAKAEQRIATLEAKGNAKAAAAHEATLEEQLRIHAAILASFDATTVDASGATQLADVVQARVEAMVTKRAEREARVERAPATESQQAAEGRKGAAEAKIAEVERFIARAEDRGRVEAEAITAAKVKLDAAKALVADGTAKAAAAAFGEAFVKFGEAHRTAQQAKLIVTFEGKGDLPEQVRARLGIVVTVEPAADEEEDDEDEEDADEEEDEEEDKNEDAVKNKNKDENENSGDRGPASAQTLRAGKHSADVRADTNVRADGEVRSDAGRTDARTNAEVQGAVNAILPVLP